MAIPPDPRAVTQRPIDRLAQAHPNEFGGRGCPSICRLPKDCQPPANGGQKAEHVVEEPNPRGDLSPPLTIEFELQSNIGFASLAQISALRGEAFKIGGPR